MEIHDEQLAELAGKITDAYEVTKRCDGKLGDWHKKQLQAGIEAGRYLIEAKNIVASGEWMSWCKANLKGVVHRTLIRYMDIARNETHVSTQAKSLRHAYQICAKIGKPTAPPVKSDLQIIQGYLRKASDLLNAQSPADDDAEADEVCDLVAALGDWVTGYRQTKERKRLDVLNEAQFTMDFGEPEQSSEFSKAE